MVKHASQQYRVRPTQLFVRSVYMMPCPVWVMQFCGESECGRLNVCGRSGICSSDGGAGRGREGLSICHSGCTSMCGDCGGIIISGSGGGGIISSGGGDGGGGGSRGGCGKMDCSPMKNARKNDLLQKNVDISGLSSISLGPSMNFSFKKLASQSWSASKRRPALLATSSAPTSTRVQLSGARPRRAPCVCTLPPSARIAAALMKHGRHSVPRRRKPSKRPKPGRDPAPTLPPPPRHRNSGQHRPRPDPGGPHSAQPPPPPHWSGRRRAPAKRGASARCTPPSPIATWT